jgi:TPR repeat protein
MGFGRLTGYCLIAWSAKAVVAYEGDDFTGEPGFAVARNLRDTLGGNRKSKLAQLAKLADQGSVFSMIIIGDTLFREPMAPDDFLEAQSWYERACEAGSISARYRLGEILLMTNRLVDAENLFAGGVRNGEIRSKFWLGRLYIERLGKHQEGIALLKAAAAEGHITAQLLVGVAEVKGQCGVIAIPLGFVRVATALLRSAIESNKDPLSGKIG